MENPFKKKTVVELVRGVEVASGIHLSTATYGINLVGEDDHYLGFTTEEIRTLHEVLGHYLATVDGVEEPQPDRPFQVGDRGGKKNCWAVERSAVRHYS